MFFGCREDMQLYRSECNDNRIPCICGITHSDHAKKIDGIGPGNKTEKNNYTSQQ